MILIISSESDDHAFPVLDGLQERGVDVRLLDLSAFPQRLRLSIHYREGEPRYQLSDGRETVDLADCHAAWWRRPRPFELHPEIDDPVDHEFAYNECMQAIEGLWLVLDAEWVNDPTLDEKAGRKVYQLKVAQELGFEIPETLITNDPVEARSFVEERGPDSTVYKSFMSTAQAWRETRVLRPDELRLLGEVEFAPVIFQEYVSADLDLRITVVEDDIFAAAIHSQETAYRIDYRMELGEARIEQFDLPSDIAEKIRALMDRLGLVYGAIDMRVTPEGEYVFLEINPAGQWQFIEEATGMPITETFVDLLASRDEAGRDASEEDEESMGEDDESDDDKDDDEGAQGDE